MAKFDHHPDPAIAFCIEAEIIQGEVYNVMHGIQDAPEASDLLQRISVALMFNWLDEGAQDAGRLIRAEGEKLLAWIAADTFRFDHKAKFTSAEFCASFA